MKTIDIVWTFEAENDLNTIYEFYLNASDVVALRIILEIITEVDKLVFYDEFQIDDINPNYRRIIIRHFKVLYRRVQNQIVIFAVFDSRQKPSKLKKLKN